MSIEAFLVAHGFGDARRVRLPGDASFRRYERLVGGPRPALLMLCPAGKESVAPFVRVARHLRTLGLSAPDIIGEDDAAGIAIVEDLGTDTFTALLASGEDEEALYTLAVDALAALHQAPPPSWAPAWTAPAMTVATKATMLEWWWPSMFGAPPRDTTVLAFDAACAAMLAPFASDAPVLTLRDFHVDNLLRLPGRAGPAACGLLDFQDAGFGHRAYDLASLLEDARRDVPPALRSRMVARYLESAAIGDRHRFEAAFAAHAAMRHARVAALWTRLERRDGKPHYLSHAPRTWRLLGEKLAHPACAPLAAWFDTHVPAPCRRAPESRAA